MDENDRLPDMQPEPWLKNTPPGQGNPSADPGSIPAEQPPAWQSAVPENPDRSADRPPTVPPASPYGTPPGVPYVVPPASPYGTMPGTPYGVPPVYPPYGQPSAPAYGTPVPPPGYGTGAGYPPPMGQPPVWTGPASPYETVPPGYGMPPNPWEVPAEPEEDEDPGRLRILVGGRPLSLSEYLEITHLSAGHGITLLIGMILLILLFGWMAIGDAAASGNTAMIGATLLLVMGSVLALIGGLVWSRMKRERHLRMAYATRMADPAALQGQKLEFYTDRLECVTARGTSILPFSEVTAYIETANVIALFADSRRIVLRGQDLTAYDASLIRAFLRRRLPAGLVRIKAALVPRLYEPLPIPEYSSDDEVLARAAVPFSKREERRTRMKRLWSTLPVSLPMLLLMATATAQYAILTNWLLLDVAVFFVGFSALYLLAAALILTLGVHSPRGEDDESLYVALTRDGVALYRQGMCGFIARSCVRPVPDGDGVRLMCPYTSLFIPDTAMEQPRQFRAALGL